MRVTHTIADATTAAAAQHFIRHRLWFTQAMLSFPFGMHQHTSNIKHHPDPGRMHQLATCTNLVSRRKTRNKRLTVQGFGGNVRGVCCVEGDGGTRADADAATAAAAQHFIRMLHASLSPPPFSMHQHTSHIKHLPDQAP